MTAFNKVVITISNWNKKGRFAKIFNIADGITRQFYNDELQNCEIIEQITNNNQALNINEANLVILPANNVGVMFQRTLPFSIYRNDTLYGKFFINTSTSNTNKTLYQVKVSDYMNVLESQTYLGGLYNNETVSNIVADILGDIPYTISAGIGALTISGYLPIMNKRDALREVAFCTNALVSTARNDEIKIIGLPTTSSRTIGKDEIVSIETTQPNITTEIDLETTKLTTKNASTDNIFNETLNGTTSIIFDSPKFDLAITGGTIVSSNINYAIITGTGSTVTLTGKSYEETTVTTSKTNAYVVTTDIAKVETYETTLTCNNSLLDNLNFIQYKIKSRFVMGSTKVGDIVTLNGQKARVTSLDYDISQTNIYCDAELEAYYE